MDPQPHPLLNFLVRLKQTTTNVFLRVTKNLEVTRAVRRMLKCFPAKSLKLIPHQIDSMGTGVIMLKGDSVRQHSRVFSLYGTSQHPQPPRNEPQLTVLLCLPPFPILGEHTLLVHYANLHSNKETIVRTSAFSLCMSHTLQMAVLIRNSIVASFCEECVLWRVFGFDWTAPHKLMQFSSTLYVIK